MSAPPAASTPAIVAPALSRGGAGRILVAVLALAVLGVGAYLLWSKTQVDAILSQVGITPAPAANQVSTACKAALAGFTDELTELDSRLSVGLNFRDYSEMVGDARVAYDRIDTTALDATCLTLLGKPAEDAMNAYIRAYNTWNDCIGKTGCSFDDVETKVQAEWSTATSQLAVVRARIR